MATKAKRLAILGSTGSIGRQTADVVRASPRQFSIVGLAAGRNTDLLAQQIDEFQPRFVYYQDKAKALSASSNYEFMSPEDMASHPDVDMAVIATSGNSGLRPTLAAVRAGKNIALANKESLVTAGEFIIGEAKMSGARILPVDSEHSAIWQCLGGERQRPARLILTASGGPFRGYSKAELAGVTAAQALQHPSWQMGPKVTIDSATLMNKGLEVIEAHWLFDMPFERIDILIHPQSIVHSMVEFVDGSVKAQLSCPDMRLPIQYALSYPRRRPNPGLPRLDWGHIDSLTLQQPDPDTFPCLRLAIEAGKQGGTYPAVLCAADEIAVGLFLEERLKFTDIARLIEQALNEHQATAHPDQEQIIAADTWARNRVLTLATGDN
ncbi:MAG: 1-deoxy-D-xylulose-5-phosphate reductoisomerase [Chloroflexota bacterium]